VASGVRLIAAAPGRLWVALCATLAAATLLAWWAPTTLLDWQPAKTWDEPWRWWTAASVHWSERHLAGNLAATALVAAYGWSARIPERVAWAWFAAWPLTHLGLLLQPALAHYGGLSGVLHAGVAAVSFWLAWPGPGPGRRRVVGLLMLAGLTAKLLIEAPWGDPLRHSAGWDIALAPLGHATGSIAGLLCAAAVAMLRPPQSRG
jgi:rhomboid family GlyGly-CTERM serine protease